MASVTIHSDGPRRPISELIPYAKNSRTHTEHQIKQVAGSIREFGFTNPVIISEENDIVAGHCRVMAAELLGMAEVPVIELKGLDATQRQALVIADNQLALNAGWNLELLSTEIKALDHAGFQVGLLGFDEAALNGFLTSTDPVENENKIPDDVPSVTEPGDVWILGSHRLMCGDSTNADDVAKLLHGVKPLLMVTDPPYGVEYDANWRNEADRGNGESYRATAIGKVANDGRANWSEAYSLFPGDVAYVWHPPGALQFEFFQTITACDFDIRMQIIWAKSHFPIGRGHYHVQHEPCYYCVRKGKKAHWAGDRKQTTIWNIDKPQASETGHSTQKPVECMRRPIVNNSTPGQAVYEPFSGSGTTIIAAETTGRACYAMEIEPSYVDIAVRRWVEFTGQEPIHDKAGS